MHVMTRQELFEAAWERPLTKVAADLGVTSTALKKTCSRHHIPTPSRGYWAAVAAGGVFKRPKLAPVKNPQLETIRIVGVPPQPEAVTKARRAAQERFSQTKTQPASVQDEAETLPPEVSTTRKALERAKPSPAGFVHVSGKGVVPATLAPASVDRVLTWLGALIRLAQSQGARLEPTEHGVCLRIDDEAVAFRIEEKPERTPHVPTAKELAEKAKRADWGYARRDPWPKYDDSPSGLLSIVIDANSWSGLRRTYSDTKTQGLEAKTVEILSAFATHAALIKEKRREAEKAQRRAAQAEARRLRHAAFEGREKRRAQFVALVAGELEERSKLSAVLTHIERCDAAERDRLGDMAQWLRRRLAQTDALLSPVFLDLSARSAGIDFDERRARAKASEDPWAYHPPTALHLWSLDEAADTARSQSPLDWAAATGLIDDPASAGDPEPQDG